MRRQRILVKTRRQTGPEGESTIAATAKRIVRIVLNGNVIHVLINDKKPHHVELYIAGGRDFQLADVE